MRQGAGTGGGPGGCWKVAQFFGDLLIDLILRMREVGRSVIFLRWRQPIFLVVVPATSGGLAVGDENPEPNALRPIEGLHEVFLLRSGPLFEKRSRREEEVICDETSAE